MIIARGCSLVGAGTGDSDARVDEHGAETSAPGATSSPKLEGLPADGRPRVETSLQVNTRRRRRAATSWRCDA